MRIWEKPPVIRKQRPSSPAMRADPSWVGSLFLQAIPLLPGQKQRAGSWSRPSIPSCHRVRHRFTLPQAVIAPGRYFLLASAAVVTATAAATAVVVGVAGAEVAASAAADQQQDDDDNPASVAIAHIGLPPFHLVHCILCRGGKMGARGAKSLARCIG